ncbi:GNAT family N-acetyltransferase [Saccharibacillus alkalitolerans]|uniref:GNAT family N-acetyltransferase n=1 Tax=Saccharibacillus alkalitolerans TaxID=2705290 RepID=A0ABX0FB29_9BACL|nr:GNAT family N-acetyltransferase [Saccharibacillus alkalitolerans]NGZ76679.1 GNAT family N-acetyltransferase [Saccharibacillus alkalitolerans]
MNNSSIYGSIPGESAPFTLESRDILLREFVPEDLNDFCAVTAEPHIREFLPDWHVDKETRRVWLRDYEIPGSREFLEAAARGAQVEDRMLRLAVIERSSGRFVGWCCTGIKDELPRPNREIVYGLSAACRGRGYMTQAVTLLADWLFAHTDLRLINGLARPNNVASNRVLQKCGFERLGELMLEDGLFLHYALERPTDGTHDRKRMPDESTPAKIANESKSAQLSLGKELCLQTAAAGDAEDLRALMIEIEADETRRWYEGGERPYIPGFDSLSMQIYQMRDGLYDKIMLGDRLVGVVLVSTTGREHGRIDRLYLSPFAQNAGIGSRVLDLIERKHASVTEWSLDTIVRSPRNLHFYEKNGYVHTGEDEEYAYYVKKIGVSGANRAAGPSFSPHGTDANETADAPDGEHDSAARDDAHIVRTDETGTSASADEACFPPAPRFENRSFARADFRHCDLSEADFMGGDLSRSAYSHLNMAQASFNNCNLRELRLANANLRGSRIGDSSMDGSEILHVSLTGTSIRNCDLSNVRLADCRYAGMTIDGIPVDDLLTAYRRSAE